ncbi:MAG: presenilin family intramembrane aspartyl protease [Candidatus Altiarchaeia archaeon]
MKAKHLTPVLLAAAIYLLVQGIGLYISNIGPHGTGGIIDNVKNGTDLPPVVEKPEDVNSSLQIFGYILVATALMLFLMKYKFDFIIKLIIYMGLFWGLMITLWGLSGVAGALLGVPLFILAYWKRNNLTVINFLLIFSLPGIGSWMGASLAFIPSLILLIGLACYDMVAVFGTKHMVTLAEGAKGKLPLMFGIPIGDKVLGLGTGDLAIPLVFTVSVLRDYDLTQAIITSLGGLLGMTALFFYIVNKKDVVLPALPPITIGLLLGFELGMLI